MPTKRQLEKRVNWIGASQMAALLGQHPWLTGGDVAIEKRDKIVQQLDNDAMARGRRLEKSILAFAREELGPITRNQFRRVHDVARLASHIDGIVRETGEPVEAKSSRAFVGGEWDIDGGRVPKHVFIQAMVHMMATEREHCWVPAFLSGPFDYLMFEVARDERLVKIIRRVVPAFWEDIVEGGQELTEEWYRKLGLNVDPVRLRPTMGMLKLRHREAGKVTRIDSARAKIWHSLQEEGTRVAKEKKKLQEQIVASMGDAEVGLYEDTDEDGSKIMRAVTYFKYPNKVVEKTVVGEVMKPKVMWRADGTEWETGGNNAKESSDGEESSGNPVAGSDQDG